MRQVTATRHLADAIAICCTAYCGSRCRISGRHQPADEHAAASFAPETPNYYNHCDALCTHVYRRQKVPVRATFTAEGAAVIPRGIGLKPHAVDLWR
ncbi:hypothetical protein EVAR_29117_1 [Eumeta japonica]|uniref:Uncharacterized protein n=1 Tax=Eumeta variegata TaxID=151549 RepID=A0A4C1VNF7_EUMVA|nr:hypothetical protein EVAR_29117_1 [Eumeta japonica]